MIEQLTRAWNASQNSPEAVRAFAGSRWISSGGTIH